MHISCKMICIGMFLFVLFASCSNKESGSKNLPFLNIEEGLKNQKEMFLSDIADSIGYIKLETTPECLIGNGSAYIRNDKVFVHTIKPARVLVFNTKGKYLYKLDKQGQGPGEYTNLFQFTISNSGNRMAFTRWSPPTSGRSISKLPTPLSP